MKYQFRFGEKNLSETAAWYISCSTKLIDGLNKGLTDKVSYRVASPVTKRYYDLNLSFFR